MTVYNGAPYLSPSSIEYFVVAGGGGGGYGRSGNHSGGGGGAGGLLYGVLPSVKGNTFTITIGGGGATYANGTSSTITGSGSVSTTGGGAGGGDSLNPGNGVAGGSGGGGAGSGPSTARAGGTGTAGQGTTGGTGYGTGQGGGGGGAGGGSGFPLVDATTSISGRGGPGLQFPIFNNGYSVYFDGAGDYLTVPTNTAFSFGTGDFTIECWVYLNSKTGYPLFAMLGDGVDATPVQRLCAWALYFETSSLVFNRYTPTNVSYSFTWNPNLYQWYHVAISRSGTSLRAFVDGNQIGTTQTTSQDYSSVNAVDLHVGRFIAGGGVSYFLTGYVSNLRIVKGTAVYTSNFTPSTQPLTAITNTGLLACQRSTIVDSSANNFAITAVGNTTVRQSGPFNYYNINSYSGYFDGNGDYLSVPTSTAFDFDAGNFTIELWAYRTGAGSGDRFLISRGNGAQFLLRWNASGVLQFWINSTLINTFTFGFTVNVWYHIAVSRSGNSVKLFVNGVEVNAGTSSASISGSNTVLIGGFTTIDYFQGFISNVRILKGTALYTGAFTPPTSPLTAITNTSLLTCQNTTFIDNSTNNFTLTANGNAAPAIHNPFLEATYYAAGGGGGGTAEPGGIGGGGIGGGSIAPTAGRTNSGSGGGGGTPTGSTAGGAGGSGTVIIRYPRNNKPPASVTGSPTVSVINEFRVYQWTSSGSITL